MHFLLKWNKRLRNTAKFKGTETNMAHEEKEESKVHTIHPMSVKGRSSKRTAGHFLGTEFIYWATFSQLFLSFLEGMLLIPLEKMMKLSKHTTLQQDSIAAKDLTTND